MVNRLLDKVALVSGAGSIGPGWGNGRATAVLFAAEGARVLAADINAGALSVTKGLIDSAGGDVSVHVADVTKAIEVAGMVAACLQKYGRIDAVVNVVGGSNPGGATEISEADWDEQLRYNLTSTFLVCQSVIPIMQHQGSGSIINISSVAGIRWTGAAQVAYATAKAGIIQFSRATAVQYAPSGIRVNSIIPGQLHTPMVEHRLAKQRTGGDVSGLLSARVRRTPLGFLGDGRDTAYAAIFLASDESRFVTGTEIIVDGGLTARSD